MFRKFSASSMVANAALAVAASSAVVLGSQVGVASVAPAAYQGGVTTVVTISVIPRQQQSTCVDVSIKVSSDAGHPTGSVNFSIDGHIVDTRVVPHFGSFTEAINCGPVGTIGRVLHGSTLGRDAVQDVAFVSTAATTPGLTTGVHTLTAAYVPTGNWAPSSASTSIFIYAPSTSGGSGTPTGVDAGLATFNQAGADGTDLRIAISGAAMVAALGVVAVYRRRATR
jgi:hypothetical protein